MSFKQQIEEQEQLVKALAYSMAIKRGIENKNIDYFYILESLYGNFSDDIDILTKRVLRLQGYDIDIIKDKLDAEVLSEFHSLENDKVLIIIVCF